VTEWLVLLVPLLVLPVVLLFAFAGCKGEQFVATAGPSVKRAVFTISQTEVTCEGSMSGVGKAGVEIEVDPPTGHVPVNCLRGGKIVDTRTLLFPGTPFPAPAKRTIQPDANGDLTFSVPSAISANPQNAGCQNATPELDAANTIVTSVMLIITEGGPGGRTLFRCQRSGEYQVGQPPIPLDCRSA
jgi:hypothetical protein